MSSFCHAEGGWRLGGGRRKDLTALVLVFIENKGLPGPASGFLDPPSTQVYPHRPTPPRPRPQEWTRPPKQPGSTAWLRQLNNRARLVWSHCRP